LPLALHIKQLRLLCAAFDRQVDSVRCSAQDESTLKIAQRLTLVGIGFIFPSSDDGQQKSSCIRAQHRLVARLRFEPATNFQ